MRMPEGPQGQHNGKLLQDHPSDRAAVSSSVHSTPNFTPAHPKKSLPFQETYSPLASSIQARPLAG